MDWPMFSSGNGTVTGTFVGTALCLVPTLTSGEVLRTVLLAATGAAVSFIVSWILGRLFRNRGTKE